MNEERAQKRLQAIFEDEDRRAQDETLGEILSSKRGRRFIYLLLLRGGYFDNPFDTDPLRMAFRCGEREMVSGLFGNMLRVSPQSLELILKESHDEDVLRAERIAQIARRSDRNVYDDTPAFGTLDDPGFEP